MITEQIDCIKPTISYGYEWSKGASNRDKRGKTGKETSKLTNWKEQIKKQTGERER